MKFFTPNLYVRLNTSQGDEFNRAAMEWESALEQYRANLEVLSAFMPKRVQELAVLHQFHDSEVLSLGREFSEKISWVGDPESQQSRLVEFLFIYLLSDQSITSLHYVLRRSASKVVYQYPKVFDQRKSFWLYDEVKPDISAETGSMIGFQSEHYRQSTDFTHNILFSDGMEIEIPFREVFINSIPLSRICSNMNELTEKHVL